MANWNELKLDVLKELNNANIDNKEFIKLYLILERRINTCKNFLYNGNKFDTMCETFYPYTEAGQILDNIKDNYADDFMKLCIANNYSNDFNIGDMIA